MRTLLPTLRPDVAVLIRPCRLVAAAFPDETANPAWLHHDFLPFFLDRSQDAALAAFLGALRRDVLPDAVYWLKWDDREYPALIRWLPAGGESSAVVGLSMRLSVHWFELSPREQCVIKTLKAVHESKRTAAKLRIKVTTLNVHLRNIKAKCHLATDLDFWRFVDRHG